MVLIMYYQAYTEDRLVSVMVVFSLLHYSDPTVLQSKASCSRGASADLELSRLCRVEYWQCVLSRPLKSDNRDIRTGAEGSSMV